MSARYPRVRPTPLDKPYWEGLAAGRLQFPRCAGCGRFQWYPLPQCRHCYSEDLRWVDVDPVGTIFTYTITHQRVGFAFDAWSPFAVVVVEMTHAPGVRVCAVLHTPDLARIAIGMPVRGTFRMVDGDEPYTILEFAPA